jgi:hypothetical protein
MFGIGGFANFGVCDTLEVISQTGDAAHGTLTRLSEADMRTAGATIPSVTVKQSDAAASRGTIVIGHMRNAPNIEELRSYLQDFVQFVPTGLYFNGQKISQSRFSDIEGHENFTEIRIGAQEWRDGDMAITGRLYEDRDHTLVSAIDNWAALQNRTGPGESRDRSSSRNTGTHRAVHAYISPCRSKWSHREARECESVSCGRFGELLGEHP